MQDGDTLQSIAQAVWGDASLWYMIADANGMAGGQGLAAGMTLSIPDKVVNVHNSAGTFKVYDPNRAQGWSARVAGRRGIHRFIHRTSPGTGGQTFVEQRWNIRSNYAL